MDKIKIVIGQIFYLLTVISLEEKRALNGGYIWKCQCSCGNITSVRADSLKNGTTKSCGCLVKEITTTHGQSYSVEYQTWASMKDRCSNSNSENFINYGGRGISVCDRWLNSFENFYNDIGDRPSDDHSIDRINNDGNYEPGNCKWSTSEEQNNNTSRNKFYNYNGKNYSIEQLSKEYNINENTLTTRLSRGLTIEEAINKPIGEHSGNTVMKLSKETGINNKTLYSRLRRGYSIEEAINKG